MNDYYINRITMGSVDLIWSGSSNFLVDRTWRVAVENKFSNYIKSCVPQRLALGPLDSVVS